MVTRLYVCMFMYVTMATISIRNVFVSVNYNRISTPKFKFFRIGKLFSKKLIGAKRSKV